jgi:hypothetical protein
MLHTSREQQREFAYIMNKLRKSQPIFTQAKLTFDEKKYGKITFMPYGLLFKFATNADKVLTEEQYISQQYHILQSFQLAAFDQERNILSDDLILNDIKQRYIQSYINIGDYIKNTYKDENEAKALYAEADKLKQD